MLHAITSALQLVGSDRRRKFLVVGLLAVAVSGLEVVGALLVLLLLRLMLEPGAAPEIPLFGDISRFFPDASRTDFVVWFAAGLGLFMVVRSVVFLVQEYAVGRVAENTGVLLADRLFTGYLGMPYEFHLQRNSAELIRNAYDNVDQIVRGVFQPMAIAFAESVLVVLMLFALLAASPAATLAAALLMAVAVGLTFAVVQPRLKVLGRERQGAARSSMQHLQQGLGGLRDVMILGREQVFARSFRDARAVMARSQYLRGVLSYVPRVSIELAFMAFVLGAVVVATFQEDVAGTLATIGLFAYAGTRLQPSLQKIASSLNSLRYAQAPVDDLKSDIAVLEAAGPRDRRPVPEPLPFEDRLTFEGVRFRYEGAAEDALAGIDVAIRRGESIGVCGPTGGGKTTLLDLMCGLLAPTSGRITVDGQDLPTSRRAWQRNLGVVHQSSFLIDDTLARNIAFGVEADQVDAEALAFAVEVAQLGDVVGSLPAGLDTVVGERGVRLSGGQRQRVTLARALYRRPRLLILDEATSALDGGTESAIVDGLAHLRQSMTVVTVAHRISTIRGYDRILFLEGGRLAGQGTFAELHASNAAFRAIAA